MSCLGERKPRLVARRAPGPVRAPHDPRPHVRAHAPTRQMTLIRSHCPPPALAPALPPWPPPPPPLLPSLSVLPPSPPSPPTFAFSTALRFTVWPFPRACSQCSAAIRLPTALPTAVCRSSTAAWVCGAVARRAREHRSEVSPPCCSKWPAGRLFLPLRGRNLQQLL